MSVRVATADDLLPVMRLLDGAMLEADVDEIRARLAAGDVLVHEGEGPPAGAIVLDGTTVTVVAVRRDRRDRGIGRQLVLAARERRGPLTAEFDEGVRPFYESLGFVVRPMGGERGRYRGTLE